MLYVGAAVSVSTPQRLFYTFADQRQSKICRQVQLTTKKMTQIDDMLESLEIYIKLAVDVEAGILAGGGSLHADCEEVLLDACGLQENVWGADRIPSARAVTFESLINIRPRQNNF